MQSQPSFSTRRPLAFSIKLCHCHPPSAVVGNDANAECMAQIRGILKDAKVAYQTAELGKVDVGGGGTIAYIMALYGMDVIDCGVAVLNMHAPWEITSKADVYETKKGYVEFLNRIM